MFLFQIFFPERNFEGFNLRYVWTVCCILKYDIFIIGILLSYLNDCSENRSFWEKMQETNLFSLVALKKVVCCDTFCILSIRLKHSIFT